jgi:hypothetical protein
MEYIRYHPLLLFVVSFVLLWAGAQIGAATHRKKAALDDEVRQDFDVVLAATLTLLGLIIGFTFSMAINRYDQRKNYEEAEANAIGTAYVRLDLLPAADGARMRGLLRDYLDQRILFYTTLDDEPLRQINIRTAQLQTGLWSGIVTPAATQPTPIVALVVAGINDVLNSQGYTQAAWWNRIPISAWCLMVVIAFCCNLLVGYGARSTGVGARFLLVLPLMVSVAFMFIADIDTPRHGFIRVIPQNLLSLAESLRPQR